nr:hypothetical protein [Streptomyces armeniacus]
MDTSRRTLRRHRPRRKLTGALAAACLLAGLVPGATAAYGAEDGAPAASRTPARSAPPAPAGCPDGIPAGTDCYGGRDANGAYYTVAVPADWNGSLVMHAHGGPDLGAASPERSSEDLSRWSVLVKEGYAWAGSSYRRGGYGVRMAAEDTENLRRLFVGTFGQPHRTYVHGQSWGGNVAAKVAETYADAPRGGERSGGERSGGERSGGERSGGERPAYDAALLTNGVLAGGSRGYDYRVDLRAVYQFYCRNHPRPTEEQYPLWRGLPAGSELTKDELRSRVQECTGVDSVPEDRTDAQRRNLANILSVTELPERTLVSHLSFATFTFRDIVAERLDGRNPFSNRGVRYTGSSDDRALNRGVQRFDADPSAVRDLSYDSDLTGRVPIPVLTLHAADDPTAFVEHEAAYRASLEGGGSARNLVQTFTRESEHSALSDSEYAAAMGSLSAWVEDGRKPTPAGVAASCAAYDRAYGTGCFFDPGYVPGDYASRVYARPGGLQWPALTAEQAERWERWGNVGIEP